MELIKIDLGDYSQFYRHDGRPTALLTWIKVARVISNQATCPRMYVGCVIVDETGHIISTGYNGAPHGEPHCMTVGCKLEDDHCVRVVHAEQNAINFSIPHLLRGATVYVTFEPCQRCENTLRQMGIGRVYYAESLAEWRARNHRS